MARTPRPVRGTVVAITGAASGIGRRTAQLLAEAGATVAIGDLDEGAAQQAAKEIGRGALGAPLDVTDTASFTAFLDLVERELGPIDVLVNNAGVMWVGPYDEEPEAAARRMVDVNLLGVVRGVRLTAPRMAARHGGRGRTRGHIVTIASAASKLAPPGEATYAATKHGVHGYLSAVRSELRRRGTPVDISLIMPGVVDTELAVGTRSGAVRRLQPGEVAEAVLRVIERPRFETVIPARIALLHKAVALLPQLPRDVLLRLTLPDQVAAVRHRSDRTRYESTHFLEEKP